MLESCTVNGAVRVMENSSTLKAKEYGQRN